MCIVPGCSWYNLCCLPSLAMRADGSLIYGLRALLGEELGAVCTFPVCDAKWKAFVQRTAGPLDVQHRAYLTISGLPPLTCEAWYIVSTQLTLAVIIYHYWFCHHYLHAAFTILLPFIMETANRAPAWMYLMCVCAAFNHPSFNSLKVLFTWMISNQTNYIFMISICTFIYEPIVSGTV